MSDVATIVFVTFIPLWLGVFMFYYVVEILETLVDMALDFFTWLGS